MTIGLPVAYIYKKFLPATVFALQVVAWRIETCRRTRSTAGIGHVAGVVLAMLFKLLVETAATASAPRHAPRHAPVHHRGRDQNGNLPGPMVDGMGDGKFDADHMDADDTRMDYDTGEGTGEGEGAVSACPRFWQLCRMCFWVALSDVVRQPLAIDWRLLFQFTLFATIITNNSYPVCNNNY